VEPLEGGQPFLFIGGFQFGLKPLHIVFAHDSMDSKAYQIKKYRASISSKGHPVSPCRSRRRRSPPDRGTSRSP
jgi:hypothetical protein